MKVYLIGSLRNPRVPLIGHRLRAEGYDVFDDWFAGGPEADDRWRDYEKARGRTFGEALQGYAARNIYDFDRRHLREAQAAVMVAPAGKSGHLEFGYMIGSGKKGFILFEEEPERWDVMYQFATGVMFNIDDLVARLALPEMGRGVSWVLHPADPDYDPVLDKPTIRCKA